MKSNILMSGQECKHVLLNLKTSLKHTWLLPYAKYQLNLRDFLLDKQANLLCNLPHINNNNQNNNNSIWQDRKYF